MVWCRDGLGKVYETMKKTLQALYGSFGSDEDVSARYLPDQALCEFDGLKNMQPLVEKDSKFCRWKRIAGTTSRPAQVDGGAMLEEKVVV